MLEEKILQSSTNADRVEILSDSAYGSCEFNYAKVLSSDELLEFKDTLTSVMIELSKVEDQLAEVKADFSQKIKPLKERSKDLIQTLKHGSINVTERVYLMDDQDNNLMGYYNDRGILVHTRPLKAEERQLKIMSIAK